MKYIFALPLLIISSLNAADHSEKSITVYTGASSRSIPTVERKTFTVVEEDVQNLNTIRERTTNCIQSASTTIQRLFGDVVVEQVTVLHGLAENRRTIHTTICELFPHVLMGNKKVDINPEFAHMIQVVITLSGRRVTPSL